MGKLYALLAVGLACALLESSLAEQCGYQVGGWWEGAADGPYTWGYCFKEDAVKLDYCVHSRPWPCVPGKQYYGRGPLKLYFNYNYGAAGEAIGVDLLNNPELVVADPVIAFKTAIWFWMTPAESAKPSCHDAITGGWTPSAADQAAGRVPGFGVTTNILNGAWECGHGSTQEDKDREGFYITYCPILGTSPGMNIDCDAQLPFGWSDKPVHLPK
ncbi:hypothetical protein Taro_020409 [Colocasia esculenta]|uniref:chitinase n=1 Tax=Colocasia esculenta TaxID=4460 RepID=A0A843V8F4_COLES|nr:hypothetical protein [Colocasia esculenta]